MELRHLRYFVAIAEERSFTRAAERLWVAQPGLSTQIRRLETELGVKLFERHTRGVDLTQAGELFLERARIALAAADMAGATGRDLEAGVVGSIRLGIASGPRWRPASSLLRRFNHERPGVELTVLEAYGGTLWRDLRDGRLDALVAPAGHASADLRSRRTWLRVVGRADWHRSPAHAAVVRLPSRSWTVSGSLLRGTATVPPLTAPSPSSSTSSGWTRSWCPSRRGRRCTPRSPQTKSSP